MCFERHSALQELLFMSIELYWYLVSVIGGYAVYVRFCDESLESFPGPIRGAVVLVFFIGSGLICLRQLKRRTDARFVWSVIVLLMLGFTGQTLYSVTSSTESYGSCLSGYVLGFFLVGILLHLGGVVSSL